jgi:hypothetical protein
MNDTLDQAYTLPLMPSSGYVRRHARVKISLETNTDIGIAGSLLTGKLYISCQSLWNVRFGEIWIELQGYEKGKLFFM